MAASATPLPAGAFPADLVPALLELSLAAVLLLRPVYGPEGAEILDFVVDYLNPAAQRSLGQFGPPGATVLAHFPHLPASGVFAFYRRVFATAEAGRHEVHYQANGLDSYFYLAAQRQGPWLLVSFTDTAAQLRSPIEEALRASQARERITWVEAERQRQRLLGLIMQAPVLVAMLFGPTHQIELANEGLRHAFGARPLVGRTYREAAPELAGQHFFEQLDEVFRTGESFQADEQRLCLDRTNSGRLDPGYY
ncbi:MAG: hypothetical protein EOO59_19345, partial [Hymenobacter sp.]